MRNREIRKWIEAEGRKRHLKDKVKESYESSDGEEKVSKHHDKVAGPIFGFMLIFVGVIFLLSAVFKLFSMDKLWPLFIMIPVPFISIAIFQKGSKERFGALIPIVILTYLTTYFLWLNYNPGGWSMVKTTWPHFIMMPGAAFLITYIFMGEAGLLIPASILIVTAMVFFGLVQENKLMIGVLIILLGLLVIIRSVVKFFKSRGEDHTGD